MNDTPLDPDGLSPAPPPAPSRSLDSSRPPATQPPAGEQPNTDPWAAVPAKYLAKKDDGSVDHEASIGKLAEGYKQLESRLGTASGRPRTVEEYEVQVPEAFAEAFDIASPEFAAIKAEAHEQGLTSKQLNWAIQRHLEGASKLVAGAQALDAKAAETALKTAWGASFEENIAHADRAVAHFASDLGEPFMSAVRDRPDVIRFLARIGAELREDTPPSMGNTPAPGTIRELMASEAYQNAVHKDHAAVTKKVAAHYSRQPGAGQSL